MIVRQTQNHHQIIAVDERALIVGIDCHAAIRFGNRQCAFRFKIGMFLMLARVNLIQLNGAVCENRSGIVVANQVRVAPIALPRRGFERYQRGVGIERPGEVGHSGQFV